MVPPSLKSLTVRTTRPTYKPLGGEHPNLITLPSLLCSVQALALRDVTPCRWTLVYLLNSGLSIQMLVSSRNDVLLGYWTTQLDRHIKMVMASHLGHFKEMEISHTHTYTHYRVHRSKYNLGQGCPEYSQNCATVFATEFKNSFTTPKKRSPLYLATASILPVPWALKTITPLCGSACPECFLRTERHSAQA